MGVNEGRNDPTTDTKDQRQYNTNSTVQQRAKQDTKIEISPGRETALHNDTFSPPRFFGIFSAAHRISIALNWTTQQHTAYHYIFLPQGAFFSSFRAAGLFGISAFGWTRLNFFFHFCLYF